MKIGIVVLGALQSGGGFNQALNAVLQIGRLCDGLYEIKVYCCHQESLPYLKRFGFSAKYLKFGLTDRLACLANIHPLLGRLIRRLIPIGRAERMLVADGIDLVYFTAPCIYATGLFKLNYISTVWDLCHRDMPEFPEVRENGEFEERELLYRSILPKANLILTDSEDLAIRVKQRYGIDDERIIAMPFSPAPFLTGGAEYVRPNMSISDEYYFYPAQFWPHKNHVRILEAMRLLKDRGVFVRVAFCGKDYGNLSWVQECAMQLGVEDQVKYFGFVAPEKMNDLYENCTAVLMPTYFGPTNVPPMEAWLKGKPLIYSKHLSAQAKNAAWMVDPDSAESIADGISAMLNPKIREEFVIRGQARLEEIILERKISENKLMNALLYFDLRRHLWRL